MPGNSLPETDETALSFIKKRIQLKDTSSLPQLKDVIMKFWQENEPHCFTKLTIIYLKHIRSVLYAHGELKKY